MAIYSLTAGADLTGKLGYAVMYGSANKTVVLSTANADCIGILANDATSGKQVPVALPGQITKAKIGGSVTTGDDLYVTSAGVLVKSSGTGDENVIATALEDGSANDLIYVIVNKFVK